MNYYVVNTEAQPNGDHEVHKKNDCKHLPNPENRKDLGYFQSCRGAVAEAKKTYPKANGCYYCCNECHSS